MRTITIILAVLKVTAMSGCDGHPRAACIFKLASGEYKRRD
jgi:hypothetical protein